MKKHLIRNLFAIGVLICFAFALPNFSKKEFNVVIDAAHGGKDYGAVYNDYMEKDIAAIIAKKIEALNKDNKDVKIHFTRTGDEFVNLNERVETINKIKPDLVLSLHLNAARNPENTISGMEIFIANESDQKEQSAQYAKQLTEKIGKDYTVVTKEAGFYMLKKAEAPALVFEMGFITSEKDRGYLTTEEGQDKLANLIANFITDIK
ncbi:N-acetylmuramoyl-L-alanine amidase family protein [Flavobacterium alkalisoli]|uniref:N-acetylmuramoyl-L-alanine amidase family protein n=1 Tax=Flavobacterium alkalisoli TaxID=2602769 RepID=UPI003A9252A5